jgi:hypothetical protein
MFIASPPFQVLEEILTNNCDRSGHTNHIFVDRTVIGRLYGEYRKARTGKGRCLFRMNRSYLTVLACPVS